MEEQSPLEAALGIEEKGVDGEEKFTKIAKALNIDIDNGDTDTNLTLRDYILNLEALLKCDAKLDRIEDDDVKVVGEISEREQLKSLRVVLREEKKASARVISWDPDVDLDAFQLLEQLGSTDDDDSDVEFADERDDVALYERMGKIDLGDADNELNTTEETVETNDDDDEYEYTDLIYGDPDEDEYLPIIVLGEMHRRKNLQLQHDTDEPPNETVVKALRAHFLSERFDDMTILCHGSFLKCMKAIGATPSAKDPLVYEAKYNFDSEEVDDKWKVQKHDAEVRLMRYRELIDAMSAKGVKAGDDWVVRGVYDDGYEGGTDVCQDSLTLDQMLAFAQAMSYGLYYYTNFDNLYVGRGVGVSKVATITRAMGGFKDMEMDIDEGILNRQCMDLARRYGELKCPLGPEAVFKAERGGRLKRSGWGSKPHSEEIMPKVSGLLETMSKHLLPTDATGAFVFNAAEMLECAAQYDPAVARSLINLGGSHCGSLAIILSLRANKFAEAAQTKGEVIKERIWRQCSSALIGALCYSVKTLFAEHKDGEDDEIDAVTTFFFKKILPELVTGVESNVPQARSSALENLLQSVSTAPSTVLMRFMEKKGSWARIEAACRTSLDDCINSAADLKSSGKKKDSSWMNHMKHVTLNKATHFLECLCVRSFQLQNAEQGSFTVVAPTSLTEKMIKRGVIPLLMDIAKADVGPPSNKAMESLASISRVKDCRTIMLQDEGGLELVKRALATKDSEMFASTILLVLHLLWDEEWAEPLSSIEPGITSTTIRWGLFAMNSIIERAQDRVKEKEALCAEYNKLNQEAWDLDDGDEKERMESERDEVLKKFAAAGCEFELETSKNFTPLDRLLLRCCLMMQVVSKLEGGPEQLVECGGLSLLSSCIDIPIRDTQVAAVTALRNAFVVLGTDGITPSNFNDPAHLVRALCGAGVYMVDTPNLIIMMTETAGRLKAVPIWIPYFGQLPEFMQVVAKIVPPIYEGLAERPEDVRMVDPISNANLTGKLSCCSGCGKLESKRGSFSKCSGCYERSYCSRDVSSYPRFCLY